MNPILRNVLAVLGAALIGMVVNLSLVNLGPFIIPLPEGVDVSTPEGLKAGMAIMKPQNFIFPFLGHALGTLASAFAVAKLAANNHMKFALAMGFLFLLGGIGMIKMVGGPLWFKVLDLIGAYIPMGWLGGKFALKTTSAKNL